VRYVEKAKEIAKKKGIAFTHISTELGKSRGYLSEMLANGRDLPEHMLADVASLLGVTVADLTGGFENEEKPTAQGDGLKLNSYEDIDQWLDTLDGKGLDMVIAMAAAKKVKVNEDKS
jgi:transcriptional regulator with XRE-family HTH domain